jgi:polar amino acid transport system substrate-binding protein
LILSHVQTCDATGGVMRNRWMICALMCIFMCVLLSGFAFAGRAIVVAVNANWPPMQMKDDKGTITGYEIDMIRAIADEAGFQVKIVNVPWGKILKGLNAGKYDAVMASVSITENRKEKFDFSEPYFTAEQLLVIPKALVGTTLTGKEIAVFKLTTGADAIRESQRCKMTYYTAEETEKAFKDLADGKVAGVLCDSPMALKYAFSKGEYYGKFAITSETYVVENQMPKEEYGIAVKKGDAKTLDLINKGLQAVKAKGIDNQIRDKWFRFLFSS